MALFKMKEIMSGRRHRTLDTMIDKCQLDSLHIKLPHFWDGQRKNSRRRT